MFQMNSSMLDACVLAVLNKEDAYGYILTQRIRNIIDISESTLYPVLRRLQKTGDLTTYDHEFQGRNRRYYKITPTGKKKLQTYQSEWIKFKDRIDKILLGGLSYE